MPNRRLNERLMEQRVANRAIIVAKDIKKCEWWVVYLNRCVFIQIYYRLIKSLMLHWYMWITIRIGKIVFKLCVFNQICKCEKYIIILHLDQPNITYLFLNLTMLFLWVNFSKHHQWFVAKVEQSKLDFVCQARMLGARALTCQKACISWQPKSTLRAWTGQTNKSRAKETYPNWCFRFNHCIRR